MPGRVNNNNVDPSGYTPPTTQPPAPTARSSTVRGHAPNPMFGGLQREDAPYLPVAGNSLIHEATTSHPSFGYASQPPVGTHTRPATTMLPPPQMLSPGRVGAIQNFLCTAWMHADVDTNDQHWQFAVPAALQAIQSNMYGVMTVQRSDARAHYLDFSQIRLGDNTYSASLRISAEDGSGSLELRCVDNESAIKCNVAWARTVSPTPVQFPAYGTLPASQRRTIDAALGAIRYLTPAQQVQHDDGSNTTVFTDIPSSGYRWHVTVHSTNDAVLSSDGTILTYPVTKIEARTGTWAITCRIDPTTPQTVATGPSYAGGTMHDPAAMSMRGPY